jgi:hypothetical protein
MKILHNKKWDVIGVQEHCTIFVLVKRASWNVNYFIRSNFSQLDLNTARYRSIVQYYAIMTSY